MVELIITHWQYFKKGKSISINEINKTIDKKNLNDLAQEISKENNIPIKDIYFIYKEKA